jgi:FlaG/FlaF family flagellin (archaellin)
MEDNGQSSNLTVGATSTEVLRKRPYGSRVAFSITNYSALTVYLNLSDTGIAEAGKGIGLYPGGTISDSSSDVYKCWQGTINAQEATGAATLSIWERVLG